MTFNIFIRPLVLLGPTLFFTAMVIKASQNYGIYICMQAHSVWSACGRSHRYQQCFPREVVFSVLNLGMIPFIQRGQWPYCERATSAVSCCVALRATCCILGICVCVCVCVCVCMSMICHLTPCCDVVDRHAAPMCTIDCSLSAPRLMISDTFISLTSCASRMQVLRLPPQHAHVYQLIFGLSKATLRCSSSFAAGSQTQ